MEIKLLPRPFGCVLVPVQILTLGLATLALRAAERHFPKRMDDDGVETRGGKQIKWAAITGVRPIRHVMGPKVIAEEVIFDSPQGRFALHSRRIANYEEMKAFALARVPKTATKVV